MLWIILALSNANKDENKVQFISIQFKLYGTNYYTWLSQGNSPIQNKALKGLYTEEPQQIQRQILCRSCREGLLSHDLHLHPF